MTFYVQALYMWMRSVSNVVKVKYFFRSGIFLFAAFLTDDRSVYWKRTLELSNTQELLLLSHGKSRCLIDSSQTHKNILGQNFF